MAEGILGLGSSGASSLNGELLEKLKEAERKAVVKPIEDRIEKITKEEGESDTLKAIVAQVNQFLETVKPFDLYISEGVNAFDQKLANVTGDSAVFDAVDVAQISEGTTEVFVEQLAKRDVFQTNSFGDAKSIISSTDPSIENILTLSMPGKPVYQSDKSVTNDSVIDAEGGSITINVEGEDKVFNISGSTTYSDLINTINQDEKLDAKLSSEGRLSISHKDKKTDITVTENLTAESIGISKGEKFSTKDISYEDLAKKINANSSYSANIGKVGDSSNRLVIKSNQSGLENKITINQQGFDLGLQDPVNNTVEAQNLKAKVDGIDYDVSSNVLVVNGGLKITAVEVNEPGKFSSISIEKDVSTVEPMLKNFVNEYNNLISAIDNELYSADSTIQDKSTLRTIVDGIKDKIFGSYGEDKLSVFNVGFEIDKSGVLSLDSEKFNEVAANDIETLKNLFIGVAEDPGLGTSLKEYVDSLDSFDGLLTKYEENMNLRKDSLEEEKTKAQESLDSRYSLLAQQFASYGAIITQFENQFSGLKMMIEQSISGS